MDKKDSEQAEGGGVMQKRKIDELISHFNRRVADMDISQDSKMELLGMVTALGFKHEKSAQQWIPCSERLPIEDVKSYAPYDEHLSAFVMVTLKGQTWPYKKLTVKLARYSYSRNEWRIANNNLGEVIAWMPMPEPWKEGEADGNQH